MRQVSTPGVPGAGFIRRPVSHAEDAIGKEAQIKKYTPLLDKIARSFGFGEGEAPELVEEVCTYARTHRAADCYPFRIWVAKIMVHTCTFRIGSRLFGQSGRTPEQTKTGLWDDDCRCSSAGEQKLQDMPLSFRAVYILHHTLGFTTSELSLILNTTPSKVLERFNKALAFLAKP